ncbi:hypothetical protein RIF23_11605 [Lipingzhangella sp. LS1_29]|uniref:Flp family type IVb pilin n=1 Tax=Lipingzhangella rawalii TaxID=2055835 RepID=A0ABU2H6K5_9ACTN|nr:hypothetical protein [Lipingzhangella rawalii]MDS1270944.1 hypothetical protein [Lipingzhangella rawalii]
MRFPQHTAVWCQEMGHRARSAFAERARRRNSDQGASMIEYVAVVVFVFLIAVAIFGLNLHNDIQAAVSNMIDAILSGDGGAEPGP